MDEPDDIEQKSSLANSSEELNRESSSELGQRRARGVDALFSRPVAKNAADAELEARAVADARTARSLAAAANIAADATAGIERKASHLSVPKFEKKASFISVEMAAINEATSRRKRGNGFSKLLKNKVNSIGARLNESFKSAPASETANHHKEGPTPKEDIVVDIDAGDESDNEEHINSLATKINLASLKDHCLSFDQLVAKYKTKADPKKPLQSEGISSNDAEERIKLLGANVYTPPQRIPLHVKFMECLTNLFNILLFAAGVIYLILYAADSSNSKESLWIGCTLITVAFIYAGIEFYEIQKISYILNSFKNMVQPQACVLRDGKRTTIESTNIVPGDVMYLRSGDRIPADAVVFHSTDMRIDGSSLSGESEPVLRLPKLDGCRENIDPFDAPNLVFSTDVVVSGEGFAIAVQTGPRSVIGKISRLTKQERPRTSPLSMEIRQFTRTISSLAGVTAFLFFFVALLRGRNMTYAATFGIGILLAWVPQGLPLTVTMILAISGRRMAEQKVLVKDLHAVETLGGITMLATDKTGTLTKNEMTVVDIWTNGAMFYAGPGGLQAIPKGQRALRLDGSGVAQILHISVTCSRARFERTDVPAAKRTVIGDATEAGLLRFAGEKLINIDKLPEIYPKVLEIPFTSEIKTHLTIHRKGHAQGGLTLHMKGAPEVIWELCSTIWIENKAQPIDAAWRYKFQSALDDLARKGSRVLGFAMLQLPGDKYPDNWKFSVDKKNYPTTGLTFVGLVGMEDPPKEGVAEAITEMRRAGIKVVMITGDSPITAESISRKVDIVRKNTLQRISTRDDLPVKPPTTEPDTVKNNSVGSILVSGRALPYLSDEDWFNILDHEEIIFARTLPADKLEIVKHAQILGHIVAVTGDGVNDSAALKKADLGIAMNRTGSDISKESAKMILLDDNFASTVRGIQEGRLIFTNIKKSIRYSLTHILPEILPYLLYVVVPIPLALTPTQILAVDLGFELLMTLSFAYEPAEDVGVLMSMPPRKPVTHQSALANFQVYQRSKVHVPSSQLNVGPAVGGLPLQAADDEGLDSSLLLHEMGITDGEVRNQDIQLQMKVLNNRLRNRYGRYAEETKAIFTSLDYWKMQYRNWRELTDANPSCERLVNGEVLLYSYLEAGVIEFCGALTTYFAVFWYTFGVSSKDARYGQIPGNVYWKPHSPTLRLESGVMFTGSMQYEAIRQVQSAYYLSIFIIQIWNLFACKYRDTMPFRRNIVTNKSTWLAIFSGFFLAGLIVYTPVTNVVFLTSLKLNPLYLAIPMAFGALLYIYSVARTILTRLVDIRELFTNFTRLPASGRQQ